MLSFLKRHSLIVASLMFAVLSFQIASSNVKGIGSSIIIGRVVTSVTAPVMATVNYTIDGAADIWNNYIYLVNLKQENETLKGIVVQLKQENNGYKENLLTDNRLREFFSFTENMPISFKASNVIGINNLDWFRTITIDKGAEDDIVKDMAVLTANGIVGRVVESYSKTSKILLAIDPRSNIDVIIQRSRIKGIAEGKGDNRLILKYVQQFEDVQIGDVVVSAGIGGIFPKGIMVGEVVKVEKSDDSFFKSIEIKTSVDFKKLEEVLIAANQPEK
ncbi:MAG: rod shape-determining protein MreC [Deltaproteobacteria bacterium]|nr:rod shape-determining protein MreC [Deltaproteobacteria bacterium]